MDQRIYKKNISELKQTDRELANAVMSVSSSDDMEIVSAKNNMPSLRVNNISLHSLYDPVKEAKEWVTHHAGEIEKAASVYVFGFGLGYHVRELCNITDREVTVFEPRLDILRKALETRDVTSLLSRIRIITNEKISSPVNNITVLPHSPSVNLNRTYFDVIQKKLKTLESIRKGMRILVVSPVYGGSLPIARYCSSSLIKMGYRVELVDNSRFNDALFLAKDTTGGGERYNRLVDLLSSFISEVVMSRCEAFRPDIVLALAQAPLTPECLQQLRQHRVTTAYWFVEDFRFMDYWAKIAPYYDFFFTVQEDTFFNEMDKAGLKNYYYLPVAACPDIHQPVQLSDEDKSHYGSDVSFVGAGYYNRRHFLKGLIDFDLKVWGTDWDMHSALAMCIQRQGERIDTDDVVRIFNATRININLHSSTYHKGINPFGDFVNPRTFEIMASGGFQIVDRRSGLEGLFEIGDEIVLFEDLDDLRNMITHYLDNPGERETIAKKGRQRVLKEHTYEDRMNEMLEVIAEKGFEQPLWTRDGEAVARLIEESAGDAELVTYLSRFSERGRITLSDITEEISKGEGDISRTEALFLMMNEFVR